MRVERLIVGRFHAPAGIFRRGENMQTTVSYPVPAYLVTISIAASRIAGVAQRAV